MISSGKVAGWTCGWRSLFLKKLRHPELASRRTARHDGAPMPTLPTQFTGATVMTKANIYFDGKVVSHTLLVPGGTKKTLGLIYPGAYHFGTDAPERMEIIAGGLSRHAGRHDGRQGLRGRHLLRRGWQERLHDRGEGRRVRIHLLVPRLR